jgi:hypothetical protein
VNLLNNTSLRIFVGGLAYFVIGYGSTLFDQPFSGRVHFWRLAAWVASAVVYVAHVAYEHFGLENSPIKTTIHVALAVAMGGLLLAVAAMTHAAMASEHAPFTRFVIALVAWPLITGVPAFLVTVVITGALRWLKIPHQSFASKV